MTAYDIHAVDGVKLLFTPTKPLDILISQTAVAKYQSIFSFMLKLVRAEEALGRLQVSKLWKTRDEKMRRSIRFDDDELKCIFKLKHDMTVFLKGLETYVSCVGIREIWAAFGEIVESILGRSNQDAAIRTIEEIEKLHQGALDRIQYRLFLRHKQEPVLKLLHGLLQLILDFSRCVANVYDERSLQVKEIEEKWAQMKMMFDMIVEKRIEVERTRKTSSKVDLQVLENRKKDDVAAFEALVSLCASR